MSLDTFLAWPLRRGLTLLVAASFATVALAPQILAQSRPLDVETVMQDPVWIGEAPGGVTWSDDSRWIYFRWNPERGSVSEYFKIPAAGGTPEKVSLEELLSLPGTVGASGSGLTLNLGGEWDDARRRKLFVRNGDIWLYDLRRDTQTQLTFTAESAGSLQWSADEKRVIYRVGLDVFSLGLETGDLRQHVRFPSSSPARGQGSEPRTALQRWLEQQQQELFDYFRSQQESRQQAAEIRRQLPSPQRPATARLGQGEQLAGSAISSDGRYVIFRTRIPGPQGRRTMVPDYVRTSGFTEEINSRTKVGEPLDRFRLGIVDTERDSTYYVDFDMLDDLVSDPLGPPAAWGNWKQERGARIPISPGLGLFHSDNRRAVVDVRSLDNKNRFLMGLDLATGRVHMIDHQRDEAWIGGPIGGLGWMPDGERIWYLSEKTGYAHLYTRNGDGSGERALTSGRFEIYGVDLDAAGRRWFFQANDQHPGVRHYYSMPLEGGAWTRYTEGEGMHAVTPSPDRRWMANLHSRSNHPPELFVKRLRAGDALQQITRSTTQEWLSYGWIAPPVVTFTARDGQEVYARLYKPAHWQPGGPAVIFVHGAGYLQNAHKWWSSYFREYMFHHLLMQRGFLVLDIDFRASAGYGRDWRTGIYQHMGGKDLTDHVDGARWLVAEHGVDPARIGLYGGSYGGFITLMAMFNKSDVFAAGAALRPVTDWAHYNHGYTSNILNTPTGDEEAYRRSSPIYFAEGLQGALLICHPLVDTNVHAQDSIRLAQRLIELRKENWELALFPVENHGFTEPTSWMDQYKRILKLFEDHLK